MKHCEIDVSDLLPTAYGCVREDVVRNKLQAITAGKKVLVLVIPSEVYSGKFYIADGHHTTLAYKRLNKKPLTTILETSEDLFKFKSIVKTINSERIYDIAKFRDYLHNWYLRANKHSVYTFQELEEKLEQ